MPTDEPSRSRIEEISRTLVEARETRTVLPSFPGALPSSLSDAYMVQSHSLKRWKDEVVGWKVGGIPPHLRSVLGEDWLAGPIFRKRRETAAGEAVTMAVFHGGFAAVEAEFVLELGDVSDLDKFQPAPEDIIPFIRACYIGVEIASSPMPDINVLGPLAVISDFGNNNGMIVGEKLESWSAQSLTEIAIETSIEGELVGVATAPGMPGGPIGAAAFLVGNLNKRGLPIPEGLKVSSGALTGIHDIKVGQTSRVAFEGIGAIDIQIVALED